MSGKWSGKNAGKGISKFQNSWGWGMPLVPLEKKGLWRARDLKITWVRPCLRCPAVSSPPQPHPAYSGYSCILNFQFILFLQWSSIPSNVCILITPVPTKASRFPFSLFLIFSKRTCLNNKTTFVCWFKTPWQLGQTRHLSLPRLSRKTDR